MKVLVDDQLRDRFREVHEAVELRDAAGRTYGYYHPALEAHEHHPGPGPSPFSDEELARRQSLPGGRPLSEIWRDLAAR
jgi:hypothetical protein